MEPSATTITQISNKATVALDKYLSYYFTLANKSQVDADVTITMAVGGIDAGCTANFLIQAGEVVTVPVPTMRVETCTITTSSRIELIEAAPQYVSASAELNNAAFEVTNIGGFRNSFKTGSRVFTLTKPNDCVVVRPVNGAAIYVLEVTTNRRLRVLRGRVTYYIVGKATFATTEDFTQEMSFITSESCVMAVTTKVVRKTANSNSNVTTWRV